MKLSRTLVKSVPRRNNFGKWWNEYASNHNSILACRPRTSSQNRWQMPERFFDNCTQVGESLEIRTIVQVHVMDLMVNQFDVPRVLRQMIQYT
jgi:hypothetical protein